MEIRYENDANMLSFLERVFSFLGVKSLNSECEA